MAYERKNRGFTLVEIMVVLALITLLVGLSLPFFGNRLTGTKFDATVRDIRSAMRHARAVALRSEKPAYVRFNLDEGSFQATGLAVRSVPGNVRITIVDPFKGKIRGGDYFFTFNKRGFSSGGAVLLENEREKFRVSLDPVVGAVIVEQ